MEEQGAVRRGRGDARGRGRPRLTYEIAPRLDYADIVALFAAHLGGTAAEREARALKIGADLAHRVRPTRGRTGLSVSDLIVEVLGDLGFQIRSVLTTFGEIEIQICTCPLAAVAQTAPEVVRGIQQGLMQEVIDVHRNAIGVRYDVEVRPDARHGSCEVSLNLRPAVSAEN